ncbi:MAG: hypothetical protein ACR2HG_08575 [Pyrinomonadaceae bacterium]
MKYQMKWSKFFYVVMCLVSSCVLFQVEAAGQNKQSKLWKNINEADFTDKSRRVTGAEKYLVYRLDTKALKNLTADAPLEFTEAARQTEVVLEIPTPDGSIARFRIEESPMLAAAIAAQFPN